MSVIILPSTPKQPPGNVLVTETATGEIVQESDGFVCCHCNKIIMVHIGSGRERGFCHSCMDVHCGGEKCWSCTPFERWLEAMEATSLNRRRLWQRLESGGKEFF